MVNRTQGKDAPLCSGFRNGSYGHIKLFPQFLSILFQTVRRNTTHFHSTCTRNRSCGKRQFKQLCRLSGILTIHLKEITDLKQHNVIRVGGFYLVVSPFSGRRFF